MGKTIEAKNDLSIHPEMKKMLFSDLPEHDDDRFDIHDERSAQNYEHYKELAYNYYRTKLQFFEDSFDNQMGYTTNKFFEEKSVIEEQDDWMSAKIDYMYNYMYFDHDRARVREKFLKEMNKRTTLLDIGEKLDKLVVDSKAANWKHYDLAENWNDEPERASRDYHSTDFKWSGKILRMMDPKAPLFIDDPK